MLDSKILHYPTYDSADELYLGALNSVLTTGHWAGPVKDATSVGSRFGRKPRRFLEVSPIIAELSNPRARWTWNRARAMSATNAVGLLMWFLSESDQVADIGFYNEHAKSFSDDGCSLQGALGGRLSRRALEAAVRRLRQDPASRRVVLPVFAIRDLFTDSRDIPCLVSLQLFVRNERLDAIATMRSTNAVGVFLYDLFLLTMIQELVASLLGMEIGRYVHISNSMHIYEDEISQAEAVLDCDESLPRLDMPRMPSANWSLLDEIVRQERQIRTGRCSIDEVDIVGLPAYWADMLRVVALRSVMVSGITDEREKLIAGLSDPFFAMVVSDRRLQEMPLEPNEKRRAV